MKRMLNLYISQIDILLNLSNHNSLNSGVGEEVHTCKYDDGIGRFTSIDPLFEKVYNAISGFGIQAGVVINSKKDVNIFDSDHKNNVVIPYKQFNDFMRK